MKITDEAIEKIEAIFGFPLYDWQKEYLKDKEGIVPIGVSWGRGNGKTFAYCLKFLLSDGEMIHRSDGVKCGNKRKIRKEDIFKYKDERCSRYTEWFKRYCLEINRTLVENGFETIII
ncbi:MAG: hypothetical protein [Circular genetic element sp.]|nr:MAG: hypothetical protein [Circular genetic element sp.]